MKRLLVLISFCLFAFTTVCTAQDGTTESTDPPAELKERKGPPGQKGKHGPPSMERIFEMDVNKDGKLSKSEVKGPLKKDFAKVDLDGDGFITKAEMKKAPKPPRRKRPQGE